MPHLTVHALEHQLVDHEQELVSALTDAVAAVYGEWSRELAVVQLVGLPVGRWAVGGVVRQQVAPTVTFGIRERALTGPSGAGVAARLAAAVTDALAGVLGEEHRAGVVVDFVAQPDDRTAVGGRLVSEAATA